MSDDLGRWSPAQPSEVADLLAGAAFPWWIAGGYAIEFAVGHETRPHSDLDVLVLRRDQLLVRELLDGWDLQVADPPGAGKLRPWQPGEVLEPPLSGLWCRRTPQSPWSFEVLLDEAEGDEWVSRRDPRVRLPIERVGRKTTDGIPFLTPEVQLFYKAKATRAKDQYDFDAAVPLLDAAQRSWLLNALDLCAPQHPWRERLMAVSRR